MKAQARKFGGMFKKRMNGGMGKPFAKGGSGKRYSGGGETDNATMEQSLSDSKSFGEAFRAARSGGGKTFMWRGKKYTTDMAKPDARPAQDAGSKYVSARRALLAAPEGEGKRRLAEHVGQLQNDYEGLASELPQRKYAKGGNVKEAKMEMQHANAMKKAGVAPKFVKQEMAEAKKYARGGGIESRGKTKGTVIKMASGGSVSARADGCAQRGKTKGRMI